MKLYRLFPLVLQFLIWIPCQVLFRYFLSVEIKGAENVVSAGKGPLIFASNHGSELDPVLLRSSLPFFWKGSPMFYVARPRSYYREGFGFRGKLFYGGLFFKAWGAYSAYPGTKNYQFSLRKIEKILKDGNNISIFPEGKMNRYAKVKEARGGTAYLSYVTGAPVIPVYISDTQNLSPKSFFSRKHHVSITYGKPVRFDELFTEDREPVVEENGRNDFRDTAQKIVGIINSLA